MKYPPLDSPEGIAILCEWAAAHNFVLSDWHRRLAVKHGVATYGVTFAPLTIPTMGN